MKSFIENKSYIHLIMAFIACFVIVSLADADVSFASDSEDPPDGGDGDSEGDERKRLSDQICKIRNIFCGPATGSIISAAIFTVGMLFFMGKMTWQTATIVSVGIVIFTNVEFIALALAPGNAVLGAIGSLFDGDGAESPFNIGCVCEPFHEIFGDVFERIRDYFRNQSE